MIDIECLQLIKPKRLYDQKLAIISNNIICLDLGAVNIVAPFKSSFSTAKIAIKDLWSNNLDAAKTDNVEAYRCRIPDVKSWNEITISANDSAVFSSLSSVGEDLFYLGNIATEGTALKISVCGITYFLTYSSSKMFSNANRFDINCDWPLFYYLFQMFKELSGKKLATLLWADTKEHLVFTNTDKSYYILIEKKFKISLIKSEHFKSATKFFSDPKGYNTPAARFKKEIQETANSDLKHLLRPFGDSLNVSENQTCYKYCSDNYTVFTTKEKK